MTLRHFGGCSAGHGIGFEIYGDDSGPRFLVFGRWSAGGPWAVARVPSKEETGRDPYYVADEIGQSVIQSVREEFGAGRWPFNPSRPVILGLDASGPGAAVIA